MLGASILVPFLAVVLSLLLRGAARSSNRAFLVDSALVGLLLGCSDAPHEAASIFALGTPGLRL